MQQDLTKILILKSEENTQSSVVINVLTSPLFVFLKKRYEKLCLYLCDSVNIMCLKLLEKVLLSGEKETSNELTVYLAHQTQIIVVWSTLSTMKSLLKKNWTLFLTNIKFILMSPQYVVPVSRSDDLLGLIEVLL